jgi:hypothetical protein
MDPGRPKFQISWNQTKQAPLHRDRHVDFDSMFFSKNGHHMRKLWRSKLFPKHAKKSQSQQSEVVLLMSSVHQHDMEDDIIMLTW